LELSVTIPANGGNPEYINTFYLYYGWILKSDLTVDKTIFELKGINNGYLSLGTIKFNSINYIIKITKLFVFFFLLVHLFILQILNFSI
jgi:hypothetical protein